MKRTLFAGALLALWVAVGAACSAPLSTPVPPATAPPERDESVEPTLVKTGLPQAEEDAMPTPTPPPPQSGLSADAQVLFGRARVDLAQRLGLRSEAVRLVAVESVQWPNAALGCPEPDRMYAQVITPGFRVIVRAAGEVYTYHADRGERLILCEEPAAPGETTGPEPLETARPGAGGAGLEALALQAQEDLARRLSLPVDQIEVLEARAITWPDGGLGCPDPDKAYAQVQQEGALIRLRAGQRVYSYHSGAGQPPFLCEQATQDVRP